MHDMFIGREAEVATLSVAFTQALAGHGQLVLIAGEPGIGKTRLLEEFARKVQSQSTILWGRCWEGDGAPALWLWMQIVRTYLSEVDPLTLAKELGSSATDIAEVVPELRAHRPGLPQSAVTDPEYARFRLFEGMVSFFKAATRRHPVVLLLDDLHWADTSSLRLLYFLVRELHHASPLLIVGAYREVEVAQSAALASILGDLMRESQFLPLRGFSPAEVRVLLTSTHATPPSDTAVAALHERTNGNPFFVGELMRLALREGGTLEGAVAFPSAHGLPLGVRETIRRRLERVSVACRQLLRTAAVIGRGFSLELLRHVASVAEAGQTTSILHWLDEAVRARLIEPQVGSTRHYRFLHALVRETLYEDLALPEQITLHTRVGEAMEHLVAANLAPSAAELADHFSKSLPSGHGGIQEKAVRYALMAGDQAMQVFAYEEALSHYQRALHVLTEASSDDLQRCHVLIRIGDAQQRLGVIKDAREAYFQAAALARKAGAHTGYVQAAHALAYAALGMSQRGDPTFLPDPVKTALLDEALQLITDEDPDLRAQLLSCLLNVFLFLLTPERREILSQEALKLARRVGTPATLGNALGARYSTLWGTGRGEEQLAVADETLQLGERTGHREIERNGYAFRALALLEIGDIAALDHTIQRYSAITAELRQPYYLWRAQSFRTMRALLAGQFEAGEQLAQETLACGQRAQTENAMVVFFISLLTLRREQGRMAELEEPLKHLAERYPTLPAFRSTLAFVYSEMDRQTDARRAFEQVLAQGMGAIPRDGNWFLTQEQLAHICVFLGDTVRAAEVYEMLLPYAGQNVVAGFADGCRGPVAHLLGILATVLLRWEEAEQHFTSAIAMSESMGARPFLAHSQYEYAVMLCRRDQPGGRTHALTLLDAAQEAADRLGMVRLQEKVAGQRARVAHAAPTPRPPASVVAVSNGFRFAGKRWTLTFAGHTYTQRDAKGLHDIAFLLQTPTQEWHVLDLLALTDAEAPTVAANVTAELATGQLVVRRQLGADQPPPDAHARVAYRQRLQELHDELHEAEQWHDSARIMKARGEMDMLATELASAYGLVSRAWAQDEQTEKVRKTVTSRIRDVLAKLQKAHPALWQHLFTSLKTGTFCSYQPPQPTRWEF